MLFIFAWVCSMVASAGELEFGYSPTLERGAKPMFSITVPRDTESLWVQIEAGGRSWEFSRGVMAAGEKAVVNWDRDLSATEALATIKVEFKDGYVEALQVPFQYSYGGALSIDLSNAVADLQKRTLRVSVTSQVERAEIKAIGAHKSILDESVVVLGEGPGDIEVPWVGDPAEVVLLDVTLHSATAWAGFTYSPWFLDIPHDDVVFETGSSDIAADQEHKMMSLQEELNDVIDKYGDVVPVKLFIGGCTDTVGSKSSNAELSRKRARAIGAWLREHGTPIPIFYYGFGESWLASATGDEVDNATNRRAVYMVGANPPPSSAGVPVAKWSGL
jgi:outer membrane protein OmpA-like peptidoglycan-associated protein